MAYHIPHREQGSSKWLTATLVTVYIIIAVLALLYGVDSTAGDSRSKPAETKISAGGYAGSSGLHALK
jgi:hypothetical protein